MQAGCSVASSTEHWPKRINGSNFRRWEARQHPGFLVRCTVACATVRRSLRRSETACTSCCSAGLGDEFQQTTTQPIAAQRARSDEPHGRVSNLLAGSYDGRIFRCSRNIGPIKLAFCGASRSVSPPDRVGPSDVSSEPRYHVYIT